MLEFTSLSQTDVWQEEIPSGHQALHIFIKSQNSSGDFSMLAMMSLFCLISRNIPMCKAFMSLFKIIYSFLCMNVLPTCITCVPSVHKGQKRASGPLETGIQAVVTQHVGSVTYKTFIIE